MQAMLAVERVETEVSEGSGVFSEAEARRLFEMTAQRYLNMSSEHFLQLWDNNGFATPEMRSRASRVAALIPLVRKISAGKKTF